MGGTIDFITIQRDIKVSTSARHAASLLDRGVDANEMVPPASLAGVSFQIQNGSETHHGHGDADRSRSR